MKKVLITPLDWGLGHATRCIPIICELISRNCTVLIAGSGDSLTLLRKEFPSLTFFELPGYNPVYPSIGSMVWKMALQLPKFRKVIQEEHECVERIIEENKIDLVISDNRYGCWSEKISSVFITHQTNILMPKRFDWLAGVVRYFNVRMINRFTYCCIPDYPDEHGLAGELTSFGDHRIRTKVLYMGSLSRFKPSIPKQKKWDVLCVFSGPEPQRSMLEKMVRDQLSSSGLKYFIVRGIFSSLATEDEHAVNFLTNSSVCVPTDRNKKWTVRTQSTGMTQSTDMTIIGDKHSINFLTSEKLQEAIEQSEVIIARSGYSTVMDLAALGKKAIFIPTSGQTEQEYLAATLMKKKVAFSMPQNKFNLATAWQETKRYSGFTSSHDEKHLLEKMLDEILGKL